MKYFLFTFPICFMMFACGGNSGSKKPSDDKTEGKKVYDRTCAPCHGLDGSQGVSGAKDLGVSVLSLEDRIQLIQKGKGVMPGYQSTLSENEIKAVAEYTMTLKK